MTRLVPLLFLAACATDPTADELDLAAGDSVGASGKADASWVDAPTLHAGARVFAHASAGSRSVHAVWLSGSRSQPLALDVLASASDGYDVRFAVLGPLDHGKRAVLAASGYSRAETVADATVKIDTAGEHLIVVGSYGLARETFYDLDVRVDGDAARADVLASPKSGALVGNADRLVSLSLGDVLAARDFDVEVELWSAPPMQSWNATHLATSVASGNQVSGVLARFSARTTAFARTDAILYGDLVSLQIGGVVGFFEGVAAMVLRSETHGREIAQHTIHADQPGQVGNGMNAFDATFAPELDNPNIPRNGEKLSVGFINGNGDYSRIACFEYCNDLSGMETCTGGPRSCQ